MECRTSSAKHCPSLLGDQGPGPSRGVWAHDAAANDISIDRFIRVAQAHRPRHLLSVAAARSQHCVRPAGDAAQYSTLR